MEEFPTLKPIHTPKGDISDPSVAERWDVTREGMDLRVLSRQKGSDQEWLFSYHQDVRAEIFCNYKLTTENTNTICINYI